METYQQFDGVEAGCGSDLARMIYLVCGGGAGAGGRGAVIPRLEGWRLLGGLEVEVDVCVYNKIAEDKSFSIMIIVPDAVVSTSVRTNAELHTK